MEAVVIEGWGAPEVLRLTHRDTPMCGEHEVLIEVKAAGVNRPDIFQRKGNYPAPEGIVPDIPGLEVSGVIVEIGKAVSDWKIDDKVCCLIGGGGYATHVVAPAAMCLPIPLGFTFAEAAALPETVYTVWDNVFRRGALQAGESLLVHGGAGGIGSTAIQLGKAFGAIVYTTVGSADKALFCKKLGAGITINYKEQDFEDILREKSINVILDSIGGSYFEKNINLLAPEGRLVYINAMEGHRVSLNILKVMQKRILITGSTLRARDLAFKIQLTQEIRTKVWPILGKYFRPQIYREIPLKDASEAHRLMETGGFMGKLVLIP